MSSLSGDLSDFESRKRDHIRLSLDDKNEALGCAGFDRVRLLHEALPDLNFDEISLEQKTLGFNQRTPFLVSSMTAGHGESQQLNTRFAQFCENRGWFFGLGSQRRELDDPNAASEWARVRESAPQVKILSNLGLSQLITTPLKRVQDIVEACGAVGLILHTNPLQECLQPEGTPQFRGASEAIKTCAAELKVPVILKETGCGFSRETFLRANELGLSAIDVSGFGGTHWGRIEGARSPDGSSLREISSAFDDWGISTIESLAEAQKLNLDPEIWASGGVRSGVDAAKSLALGAKVVGFAKPVLQAALAGEAALDAFGAKVEHQLKIAMFCTGTKRLEEWAQRRVWQWRTD